jgi:hypothetical protein
MVVRARAATIFLSRRRSARVTLVTIPALMPGARIAHGTWNHLL